MSSEAVKDIVAASIAGAAGIVVGQPFDIVKVTLQTAKQSGKPTSLWQTASGIVKSSGFPGLFRGVVPPVIANAPINAVLFAVEGATVRAFERSKSTMSPVVQHMLGGCVAGLSQAALACPAELLKIREQLPPDVGGAPAGCKGPLAVARHVYATSGVRGLFRGLGLTAARDMPAFGLYFGVYDGAKHLMGMHVPALWEGEPGAAAAPARPSGSNAGYHGDGEEQPQGQGHALEAGESEDMARGDAQPRRKRQRHQTLGGRAITRRLTELPPSMGSGDYELEAIRVLRGLWRRERGAAGARRHADGRPAGIVEDIEAGGLAASAPRSGGTGVARTRQLGEGEGESESEGGLPPSPAVRAPLASSVSTQLGSQSAAGGAAHPPVSLLRLPPSHEASSSGPDLPGDRVGVVGQMMAGALAGMASWLFLHPVDVLKTRAQALPDGASPRERRALALLQSVVREQGPRGLLRGIQASVLRAAPVSAVIFVVYEYIQPRLPF